MGAVEIDISKSRVDRRHGSQVNAAQCVRGRAIEPRRPFGYHEIAQLRGVGIVHGVNEGRVRWIRWVIDGESVQHQATRWFKDVKHICFKDIGRVCRFTP